MSCHPAEKYFIVRLCFGFRLISEVETITRLMMSYLFYQAGGKQNPKSNLPYMLRNAMQYNAKHLRNGCNLDLSLFETAHFKPQGKINPTANGTHRPAETLHGGVAAIVSDDELATDGTPDEDSNGADPKE